MKTFLPNPSLGDPKGVPREEGGRREASGRRQAQEAGDTQQGDPGRKKEAGGRREASGRRQEAGGRRQETHSRGTQPTERLPHRNFSEGPPQVDTKLPMPMKQSLPNAFLGRS